MIGAAAQAGCSSYYIYHELLEMVVVLAIVPLGQTLDRMQGRLTGLVAVVTSKVVWGISWLRGGEEVFGA